MLGVIDNALVWKSQYAQTLADHVSITLTIMMPLVIRVMCGAVALYD